MASYKFRTWLKQSQGFGLTGTGPAPTDDLTPPTRDSVFSAQLQKADPTALDEESLLTAKIVGKCTPQEGRAVSPYPGACSLLFKRQSTVPVFYTSTATPLTPCFAETSHYASSVFRSLTTHSVIDAQGHPDTAKIDRTLVSKIAIISVPKCRELVNMLFWWEEELTRWRLLDEAAREIEGAIGEGLEERAGLEERLAVVHAKRRVLPSLRRSDGTLKSEGGEPPGYRA